MSKAQPFSTIPEAIEEIAAGRMVVVVDDVVTIVIVGWS